MMMDTLMLARQSAEVAPIFGLIMVMFIVVAAIIVAAIKALLFCKIFAKAGYPWALGLLMLVPIADIIMVLVLAFGNWPIRRELETFRKQRGNAPGAY